MGRSHERREEVSESDGGSSSTPGRDQHPALLNNFLPEQMMHYPARRKELDRVRGEMMISCSSAD